MLTTALHSNYTSYYKDIPAKMAAQDYEPKCCAIDLEYEIFKSSKAANLYKASVFSRCGEIKRTTSGKELHKTLIPKWSGDATSDLSPKEETSAEKNVCDKATNSGFSCSFIKASDLVGEEKPADSKRDNPFPGGKKRTSLYSKTKAELELKLLQDPEIEPQGKPSESLETEVASILEKYKPSTSCSQSSTHLSSKTKSSHKVVKSERVRFSDDILFKKENVSKETDSIKENKMEISNIRNGSSHKNMDVSNDRLQNSSKSHERKNSGGSCDKDRTHDKHVSSSSGDKDRKRQKRLANSMVRQGSILLCVFRL